MADIRGMEHIHHNHSYAMGSEAGVESQRPVSRDKHRGLFLPLSLCLQYRNHLEMLSIFEIIVIRWIVANQLLNYSMQ